MFQQIANHSKMLQWGIRITPSELNIHKEQFLIDTTNRPADMEIRNKPADIAVEWSHVWEEYGLERPLTYSNNYKNQLYQQSFQDIARKAQEGDRIGNIARDEKQVWFHIVNERLAEKNRVYYNIVAVPKEGPIFDVQTNPPEIHIETHNPEFNVQLAMPKFEYKTGKVDVYVEQQPIVDLRI